MKLWLRPELFLLLSLAQDVLAQGHKPILHAVPSGPQIFHGQTIGLKCTIPGERVTDWSYCWYKNDRYVYSSDNIYYHIISDIKEQHQTYSCYGYEKNGQRITERSEEVSFEVTERPKATLTLVPTGQIFSGDKVTLMCDIQRDMGSEWTYTWSKAGYSENPVYASVETREYSFYVAQSHSGVYTCTGQRSDSQSSETSDTISLTVSALPRATVSVWPENPVFAGESVTLRCEVQTYDGWMYQWYKRKQGTSWTAVTQSVQHNVNTDTITISESLVVSGDQYSCRGERNNRPSASEFGTVTLIVQVKPKPELTSSLQGAALMGNPVTLYCKLDRSAGWRFYWSNHTQNPENERNTATNSYTISSVAPSDGGQYWCRAGRGKPVYYTHYSDALWVRVIVRPKAEVMVMPDKQVFIGETVTLTCDIQGGGDTKWTYSWYKDGYEISSCTGSPQCKISSVTLFENGKYTCGGQRSDSQSSNTSDALTLTVSSKPQAVLSVFPQSWLTEGASVTLSCKVRNSSTGWTFSWYRDNQKLLSDSSRGAGGSYTVTSAAINHTGVYMCRAERGEPAYQTQYSNLQPLWITGVSPPSFLIISPNRTQHFSGDSLSLSCEGQSNSTEWRVRHYTQNGRVTDCSSGWRSVAGSTCTINYLYTFHTGVYWCQSESEVWSSPVNITVHDGDVILDSPVHVVSEGDLLTLRCLCQNAKPSNLSSSFYKDGLLILNQNTGEMAIHTVSKSDEGLYYCKYPGRGESPHSWILVRADEPSTLVGLTVGLCFALLFILLIIATWCYLTNKGGKTWPPPCGNQQNSRLTSVQEQMETGAVEGRQSPCTAFLSGQTVTH